MKTKRMAYCFLYLFIVNYVLGVVAAVHADPVRERRSAYGNPSPPGCQLTPQCVTKLETCFLKVRNDLPDDIPFSNQRVEEYEMSDITAYGFQNFVWEPFQCRCEGNSVRIFARVNFLRILLTFVLNLVEDLLGGLLGSLGSGLAKVLGNVVNLLVRILALNIIVEIVILQRFIPGTKCVIESYKVSDVITIRILGLDLQPIVQILAPILRPVVNALLQSILNDRVKAVFLKEIGSLEISRSEVIC